MTKRAKLFVRKIQKVLAVSDDLRLPKYRGHKNIYKGFCYISTEIIYHFGGGKEAGYKPYVMRIDNDTHWFLKNTSGQIIDPTVKQYKRVPDYTKARCCGFLTKQPSKRAQELFSKTKRSQK